jgi:hypothetical protein
MANVGNNQKATGKQPGGITGKGFVPGKSGNPSGRPKKKPITELYEKLLNDPKVMQKLEASLIQMLAKGNMATVLHLREMTDRVEGKVTQPIEADVTVTNLAETIAAARKRAGR